VDKRERKGEGYKKERRQGRRLRKEGRKRQTVGKQGRMGGGIEKRKYEGREEGWTPPILRCGCAPDYSWKGQSDKAAHKVG